VALLVVGLWGACTTSAPAQILDVRPDGTAVLYKGPLIASPDGLNPLANEITPPPQPVTAAIQSAAARHALSQELIAAVAWQESRMRQNAVSHKGARGVMQLAPATAQGLGVNADDLAANVDGGTTYLAQMLDRYDGDIVKSLAAYNAGPEAVDRYHGVPPFPETRAYVNAVLDRLAEMSKNQKGQP